MISVCYYLPILPLTAKYMRENQFFGTITAGCRRKSIIILMASFSAKNKTYELGQYVTVDMM